MIYVSFIGCEGIKQLFERQTNLLFCNVLFWPYLGRPCSLQLPLGVRLFVVEGQRLTTGGGRRAQAGTVTHGEPQRDEHPRRRVSEQEGCGQPVVLETGVLVDVTHFEGPDEFPSVVQNADLVPLKRDTGCFDAMLMHL